MGEDWIEVETGFVRATEVVAITFEEQSYEVDRPSKGITETHYFEGIILTLAGGARLLVRQTTDGATARSEVERLRALVDEKVSIVRDATVRFYADPE